MRKICTWSNWQLTLFGKSTKLMGNTLDKSIIIIIIGLCSWWATTYRTRHNNNHNNNIRHIILELCIYMYRAAKLLNYF